MSTLSISMLGAPEIRVEGKVVTIRPKKALALLLYLAATSTTHTRDHLAALFWAESNQQQARAALRRRLSELRGAIGAGWVTTDGEYVVLDSTRNVQVDIHAFYRALEDAQKYDCSQTDDRCFCIRSLENAIEHFRDDFLAGFTLPDCPEYDDWQFFLAENLRRDAVNTLDRLVQLHADEQQYDKAIAYARRRLALDPLHEPAHRTLMQLYFDSGQRAAALRQYELCAQTLDSEFQLAPEEETIKLLESIRASKAATEEQATGPEVTDTEAVQFTRTRQLLDEVRTATVVALDVDAKSEDDWVRSPNLIAERLSEFTDVVESGATRYEAALEKTYHSGFHVIFGLHQLHEDDAERALHLVLDLQRSALEKGLALSAGVSTGMIYVSHPPDVDSPTASGPTIHQALRILSAASAGDALMDASTHHQTAESFEAIGTELQLPSLRQPPTLYRLCRRKRRMLKSRGISGLSSPLIGRTEELALMRSALEAACSGKGQLVSLMGEAGVGKSRLVSELRHTVESTPDQSEAVLWLEGRSLEMRQATPYWPLIDILYANYRWTPQTSDRERAQCIQYALDEWRRQERISAERAINITNAFGILLSLHDGDEEDNSLLHASPEQVRFQTFRAITDWLLLQTEEQPVVLVMEDMHWSDPLSLDLIGHLMDYVAESRLLLLCVYRRESALRTDRLAKLASRRCPNAYTEIRLNELTLDDSRRLAEALLDVEDLTPAIERRVLDSCQGNPFFLEEVIHSQIESGLIYRDGVMWRARQGLPTEIVPTRVQSVILARVDRLAPQTKSVLQVASVCGRLFMPEVVENTFTDAASAMESLDVLEEHSFIYLEQASPYRVYTFRHVLVQEAVYRTIPGDYRSELHDRIGDMLEKMYGDDIDKNVDQLAYHFDRGRNTEKAIVYLNRAGVRARNAYLTEEAIAHFSRALERMQDLTPEQLRPEWRFTALAEQGKTYMRSSRYAEANHYLRQAIDWGIANGIDTREVARLHWWLGDLLINWSGHHLEARDLCRQGLAMLGDEESAEVALLLAVLAFTYDIEGQFDEFFAIADQLASFLERVPYSTGMRVCVGVVMTATSARKDLKTWYKWLQYGLEQARIHHDDWTRAELLMDVAAREYLMGGTPERAMESIQESAILLQQIGDSKRVNWTEIFAGDMLVDWGYSQQAEMALRKSLQSAYELNYEHVYTVLLLLTSSCLAQRKWREATEAAQRAQNQADEEKSSPIESLVLLGLASLGAGDREVAADYFVRALEYFDVPGSIFAIRRRKWWLLLYSYFASALCGLQKALGDDRLFVEFCRDYRQRHPKAEQAVFRQWYLEPASPCDTSHLALVDESREDRLSANWAWCDPDGGCSYSSEDGMVIRAPLYRDIWQLVANAPRMVRTTNGSFVAQVACSPARQDRPGVGGLLLWRDNANYLKLAVGVRSQDEVALEGEIDGDYHVFGRGILDATPVWLRIERMEQTIRALCSANGKEWLLVGQCNLWETDRPQELGLFAVGNVDRTFYWSSYPDGTAIRFQEFMLWN